MPLRAPGRAEHRGFGTHAAEAVVMLVLLSILVIQLLRYPVADDSVGAEYRAYAEHLATTGTLMPSPRLPGYPAFMVAARAILSGTLTEAAYWAQFWLLLGFTVAGWWAVRRWCGPLTAAVCVGLLAAPNPLARWTALPLPDALFAMLGVSLLLLVAWWVYAREPVGGWRWLPVVALLMSALVLLHPAAGPFLLLVLASLGVGSGVGRRWTTRADRLPPVRSTLTRIGMLAGVYAVVVTATFLVFDRGAFAFANEVLGYRVVVALPAVSTANADRRVEDAKRAYRRSEGQPIEAGRFGTYGRFDLRSSIRAADVRAVWWDRLRDNPGQFAAAVVRDLFLGHDLLARHLTPVFTSRARLLALAEPYPRDDGSPAGDLFRATGFVLDRTPAPAHAPLLVEVLTVVLRTVAAWGLAAVGIWRCWRHGAPMVVALLTLLAGLAVTAAVGPSLHVRYLLPLVPFAMLAQAIGATWLVSVLAARTGAAPSTCARSGSDASTASGGASAHRSWTPRVVEAALLLVLGVALVTQVLAYQATDDPDPDGYVSYAQRIAQTGRLSSSGRLPGYPLMLAGLLRVAPPPLNEAVYWAQAALMLAFVVGLWAVVRRWFGVLPALLAAGILAAPSYFTIMSVVMVPDAPYSILLFPVLIGLGLWTVTDRPHGGWRWLPAFALAAFALQAVRPTTFGLLVILAPALVVGLLVARRTGGGVRLAPTAAAVRRAGAIVAIAVVIQVGANMLLDTGAQRQNSEIIAYRVVTRLPAATDSPAEQRVETARRQFTEIEGQPIDEARFGTYERFDLMATIHPDDAAAVWRDRLAAHPGLYAAAVVEEIRLGHHLLARVALPYLFDPERYSLFLSRYPRNDGTPEGTFFRRTGLIADLARPPVGRYTFEAAAAAAIVEVFVIWGLIVLGCVQAWRQCGALALAYSLLLVGFVTAVATTNTVDPRYLLPFAALVACAQALGLIWLVGRLVASGPTEPNSPDRNAG